MISSPFLRVKTVEMVEKTYAYPGSQTMDSAAIAAWIFFIANGCGASS